MWRARQIGVAACVAVFGLCGPVTASAHDERGWDDRTDGSPVAADTTFIQGLDRYGDWVWEPTHGRVWRPRVDQEWRPYWRGYWSGRDNWSWVSADPWGDGPSHYGEWVWSGRFGWVWIPGAVWSPARVTWIVDGPFIAWAPVSVRITLGANPRFWVYADREHFNHDVVRPRRRPPPHGHFYGGTTIRDVDRVIAPHQPGRRVSRAPGDGSANRRFIVDSSRGSHRGAGATRERDRRDAR